MPNFYSADQGTILSKPKCVFSQNNKPPQISSDLEAPKLSMVKSLDGGSDGHGYIHQLFYIDPIIIMGNLDLIIFEQLILFFTSKHRW